MDRAYRIADADHVDAEQKYLQRVPAEWLLITADWRLKGPLHVLMQGVLVESEKEKSNQEEVWL